MACLRRHFQRREAQVGLNRDHQPDHHPGAHDREKTLVMDAGDDEQAAPHAGDGAAREAGAAAAARHEQRSRDYEHRNTGDKGRERQRAPRRVRGIAVADQARDQEETDHGAHHAGVDAAHADDGQPRRARRGGGSGGHTKGKTAGNRGIIAGAQKVNAATLKVRNGCAVCGVKKAGNIPDSCTCGQRAYRLGPGCHSCRGSLSLTERYVLSVPGCHSRECGNPVLNHSGIRNDTNNSAGTAVALPALLKSGQRLTPLVCPPDSRPRSSRGQALRGSIRNCRSSLSLTEWYVPYAPAVIPGGTHAGSKRA